MPNSAGSGRMSDGIIGSLRSLVSSTAGAAFIGACIAYRAFIEARRQADEAVKQTIEAQKQTKATQDQVAIADSALKGIQRAFITISELLIEPDGAFLRVTPVIKNTGNTPAVNVCLAMVSPHEEFFIRPIEFTGQGWAEMSFKLGAPRDPDEVLEIDVRPAFLATSVTIGPQSGLSASGLTTVMTANDGIGGQSNRLGRFLYGSVRYIDIFDVKHVSKFCFRTDGVTINAGKVELQQDICRHWNCTDQYCNADKSRYKLRIIAKKRPSPPRRNCAKSDSMMQRPPLTVLRYILLAAAAVAAGASGAVAQDKGTLEPQPLPPLANPNDPKTPAKELFGRKATPVVGDAHVLGFYADGCLAGAAALPIDGPAWQVMRLSRNRNWGHPTLIRFLENLAATVHKAGTWNGLLVGDMSQPRGGPMRSGHASHQVGLDADIWLTPMPPRKLTRFEREEMSATDVVAHDRRDVDPDIWTPGHAAVIKAAAQDPQVERIFVNAAIKKALCRDSSTDRAWMSKVRPYWGHDYHFHVRLFCPADSPQCKPQPLPPPGDGCGKDLDWWFTDAVLHPKPSAEKPAPPMTLAKLPAACRAVLAAP